MQLYSVYYVSFSVLKLCAFDAIISSGSTAEVWVQDPNSTRGAAVEVCNSVFNFFTHSATRILPILHFQFNRHILCVISAHCAAVVCASSHTNTIEATWRCVKVFLGPYNRREDCHYHLAHNMLAARCKAQGVAPFVQFLHLAAKRDWSQCDVPR